MNIETYWSDYTSAEKDLFQKSCRRLLKSTFIVRDKDEENKKAYYFISKKPEPFSIYFGYIGFDILIDRDNGVIMLKNCADMGENGKIQSNRRALKKNRKRCIVLPLDFVCRQNAFRQPVPVYVYFRGRFKL